jgi:cytoskeletal protein RodZ
MPETEIDTEKAKVEPEETKETSQTENVSQPRSHESLWGALLFACMLVFVVASIGFIGWGVYTKWKNVKMAKAEPSIMVLSEKASEESPVIAADETSLVSDALQQETGSATVSVSAKKVALSVLNGGAAKGSAGAAVDLLKKDGYINVTSGNSIKDYVGVVIYYAPALEKEAESIKMTVIKKYPLAKTLPADVKNKETSVSQVTVILGK